MTNTDNRQHRSILQGIVHRVMLERGLVPDFPVQVLTNKIPLLQSWASGPLILTSVIIVVVGASLTVSPLAGALGLVPLPPLYWLLLAIILVRYVVLAQLTKTWFYCRFGEESHTWKASTTI